MSYKDLFDKIDWDKIPSLISHEIIRSHNYFEEKNYFLVVYQIKDMYEVLIKTLCLTTIASLDKEFEDMHNIHLDTWNETYNLIKIKRKDGSLNSSKINKKIIENAFKQFSHLETIEISNIETDLLERYSIDHILSYLNFRHVLSQLVGNSLSLGDWVSMLQNLTKIENVDTDLLKVCNGLYQSISREGKNGFNLTKWRNSEIGHGALNSKISDEDIKQINRKLEIIISYIYNYLDFFYSMDFTINTESKEIIFLNGSELIKVLPSKDYPINLCLSNSKTDIDIDPLIKITNKGIYLFDSFVPFKIDAFSIDYPNGKRIKSHPDLIKWLQTKRNQININNKKIYSNIHNPILNEECRNQINNLIKAKDYIEPTYLKSKVEQFIEFNDSGSLLLYLDRGMGKTYFTKALNQFDQTNDIFKLDDTDWVFRTIHLNTYTMYNVDLFIRELPNSILGNSYTANFSLEYNSQDSSGKKQKNIATYLNRIKNEIFPDNIFVLVIDGLDELPINEDHSILFLIPNSSLLDEEVYLIFTSRTQTKTEEKSSINQGYNTIFREIEDLTKRCNIETETIHSTNREYLDFILLYLKKNNINLSEDQKERLFSDSEKQKMVSLSIMTKCYKFNKDLSIFDKDDIVLTYLSMLSKSVEFSELNSIDDISKFKSKYLKILIDVLSVLTVFKEPLNLYQIKFLIKEYTNDYELLGILNDINGLIIIDRNKTRHQLFTINHINIRRNCEKVLYHRISELNDYHKELMEEMNYIDINQLLKISFNIKERKKLKNNIKIEEIIDSAIGLYTLAANADHYYTDVQIETDFNLLNKFDVFVGNMKSISSAIMKDPTLILLRQKLYSYIDRYINNKNIHSEDQKERFYEIFSDYSWYLCETHNPINQKKSLGLFKYLIEIMEKDNKKSTLLYSKVTNRLGLLYRRLGLHEDAIRMFNNAYVFHETDKTADTLATKILANIGLDQRNMFFKQFKNIENTDMKLDSLSFKTAIKQSTKSINIKDDLFEKFKKNKNIDSIAYTYHSRGLHRFYLGILEQLNLMKIKHEEKYYKDVISTIEIFRNIDIYGESREVFEDAIHDFKKSLTLFHEAEKDNPNLSKHHIKAYCYSHLGDCLFIIGSLTDAVTYYKEALKIYIEYLDAENSVVYKLYIYTLINMISLMKFNNNDNKYLTYIEELDTLLAAIKKYYSTLPIRETYYKLIVDFFPNDKSYREFYKQN